MMQADASQAAAAEALPHRLREFRGLHAGETIVVCGCGRSLTDLPEPESRITVGVNDVGRLFDPTYLVVLNPKSQFKGDRFRHVATSRARAIFTQLNPARALGGLDHPHIVRFRLGKRGGTDLSDPDRLPYTRNSPYVAVCLAAFLGAKRIGLIGVDFTDHHFFGRTGRHPLARELPRIDREYAGLREALARRGVELVNLSPQSRLTSLPKVDPVVFDGRAETGAVGAEAQTAVPGPAPGGRRIFFVHYRYLHCGDVFERGLENAARDLGLRHRGAPADDRDLPARVAAFRPDLLFVVHGRSFRQHWGGRRRRERFGDIPSAVWLTDEPYEVDDTEGTSALFDTVFVNDPSTLDRHRNAHYLPMAFDPHRHTAGTHTAAAAGEREHAVGFVGAPSPSREKLLLALAEAGLLSYVVGGPWRSRRLRDLCLAARVTPDETADLYRRTRLVINVFRDRHHYNRQRVSPWSLNPRVYEALACGALVVSEPRPELAEVFPDLPVFEGPSALCDHVAALLAADDERWQRLGSCRRELPRHTYAARLERALALAAGEAPAAIERTERKETMPTARRRKAAKKDPRPAAAGVFRLQHPGPVVEGRVSVVVPVYNCEERFVARCLDSVRRQDFAGDIELVVVNDGSEPRFRVEEVARRFEADQVISLPRNLGVCLARNIGWLSGRGELTLFFDADDELEPGAVRVMVETLREHPEAALCYSDFTVDGKLFEAGPFTPEQLRRKNKVAIAALLRTREFVGFDERVPRGTDWDAWLRMLKLGKQGVKAPGALFHVTTRRAGRISTSVSWSEYRRALRRLHPDVQDSARPARRKAARRRPVDRKAAAVPHPSAGERTIVTAVVVYHDSQPWFEILLESLLRREFTRDPKRVHLRVLLVENPCTDTSPQVARAFREHFGDNAAIIPSRLRRARPGGAANHAHGLRTGFRRVKADSEWTLFLDADIVLLRDGWLDELLGLGADMAGPPAFAHLRDPGVPHAHPSFLLFRTRLAKPPFWNGDFRHRDNPGDGNAYWDTAIPFTMAMGRRPDVKLVRLPLSRHRSGELEYFQISDLAIHVRGVSNLSVRPQRYGPKTELLALPQVAELLEGEPRIAAAH